MPPEIALAMVRRPLSFASRIALSTPLSSQRKRGLAYRNVPETPEAAGVAVGILPPLEKRYPAKSSSAIGGYIALGNMGIDREMTMVRRGRIGWNAMTFLLLIAFALQSYLTQTHIHEILNRPAQACISECVVHAPASHSPLDETTACPLCHAIVHAGAFFAPPVAAIVGPHSWVESSPLTLVQSAPRVALARHGLSRAPPR